MAAPADMTMKSLGGNWSLNKTLSSDSEAPLEFRGISWVVRKAVAKAPIDVNLALSKQEGTDKDVLTILQSTLGRQAKEEHVLDWETTLEEKHPLFGTQKTKARFAKPGQLSAECLKEDLAEDEDIIELLVEAPDGGWTSQQAWFFKEIDGKKYYVRKYILTKADKELKGEMVFDHRP